MSIKFKLAMFQEIAIKPIVKYLLDLLNLAIKTFIIMLVITIFLVLYACNIQIQNFDSKHEKITGFTEIVQCYDMPELIQEYIHTR